MAVTQQDFTIWQGDAIGLEIAVTNDAGQPYDLTAVENIQWALSTRQSAPDLIMKSLGSGISINSPGTAGIFTVSLVEGDSAGLIGDFYHEARVTDASGNPRTVCVGTATINGSNL